MYIYVYIYIFSRGWNLQENMPWRCLWVDLQTMCNLADLHIIPVSKRHIPPSVENWVGVQWTLGISIRSGVSPPQPLMMNPMQSKMRPSQWLDLPAALQIEGCHPHLSWLPYLWSHRCAQTMIFKMHKDVSWQFQPDNISWSLDGHWPSQKDPQKTNYLCDTSAWWWGFVPA